MAQERRVPPHRRLRALARRYGLVGHRAVAAVVGALVAAIAVATATRIMGTSGMEIARSDAPVEELCEALPEGRPDREQTEEMTPAPAGPSRVLVHVDGAVALPGVYVLEKADPRINDAVELAGGLTPEADTMQVNLAAPAEDGQKVHIPARGEEAIERGTQMDGPATCDTSSEDASSGLVNVNVASAEELCTLPGVGEATAAAIIEEREGHGPFASVDDLMRVSGIGEKKLAKMRERICV